MRTNYEHYEKRREESRRRLLDALSGGKVLTANKLHLATGISNSNVKMYLRQLMAKGLVACGMRHDAVAKREVEMFWRVEGAEYDPDDDYDLPVRRRPPPATFARDQWHVAFFGLRGVGSSNNYPW